MAKEEGSPKLWNSLEIAKIFIGALTPLVVFFFGYQLSLNDKERTDRIAQFERVTQKRLDLWDEIAPGLNDIYSYLMYVGAWRELDAGEVIAKKLEIDEVVYGYQPFFSQEFFEAYLAFMDAAFETQTGIHGEIKPRTAAVERAPQDAALVSGAENAQQIHDAYYNLLHVISRDFRLKLVKPPERPKTPLEVFEQMGDPDDGI